MKKHSPMMLITLAVQGLFLAGFLLLVVFGAGVYRDAVASQGENGETRALLSYFAARAKAADREDAVHLRQEQTGPVLSFGDPDSGYAVRVYQQGGKLLEDYGREDAPLDPANATVIGETETFQVEWDGKVYTVTTDAGKTAFTLRAGASYDG